MADGNDHVIASLADLPELAAAAGADHPKSRIKLFKVGKYRHPQHGRWNITRDTFESFLRNFEQRGRVPIDLEHAPERGGSTEAAGWITRLEVVGDELYGDVEWTKIGADAIRERRFLFISPTWAWAARDEHGDPIGPALVGAGLTNRAFFPWPTLSLTASVEADRLAFADGLGELQVQEDSAQDDLPDPAAIADGVDGAVTVTIDTSLLADPAALAEAIHKASLLQVANANRPAALQVKQPFLDDCDDCKPGEPCEKHARANVLDGYPDDDEDYAGAMPELEDRAALEAAIAGCRDGSKRKKLVAHIVARAHALEAADALPEEWSQAAANEPAESPAEPDEPSDSRAGMTDELRTEIASIFKLDADDCSDFDIVEAAKQAAAPPPKREPLKGLVTIGVDGEQTVAAEQLARLQERAEAGDDAIAELGKLRFADAFGRAVRQGRATPAMEAHYQTFYASNPGACLNALAELPPLVSTEPIGRSGHRTAVASEPGSEFAIAGQASDGDKYDIDRDDLALHERAEAYCTAHTDASYADVYIAMAEGRL